MNFCIVVLLSIISLVYCSSSNQTTKTTRCRKYYPFTKIGSTNYSEFKSRELLQATRCSVDLELFLCLLYEPQYNVSNSQLVRPCASLCRRVRKDCQRVFNTFYSSIPTVFQCNQYQQCTPEQDRHKNNNNKCGHLVHPHNYVFVDRTNRCALKCNNTGLFNYEARNVAQIYLAMLTLLTLASTSLTLITLLLTKQIQFPQQPILMISLSYLAHAISLSTVMFLGRQRVSCDTEPVSGQRILIQEGLENTSCALTFLVNFYFSVSANLWWLVLVFTWLLLRTGCVRSLATVTRHSGFVHLSVWALTSCLTVCVLILRTVDADELLGLCYVGGQNPSVKLAFSILPRSICLLLGLLGTLFAFFSHQHKSSQSDSGLARFCLLYMIPMFILTLCELYEYYYHDSWLSGAATPIFELLLLKICASQLNGIHTIVWVCYDDTVKRIVSFYSRLQSDEKNGDKSVENC